MIKKISIENYKGIKEEVGINMKYSKYINNMFDDLIDSDKQVFASEKIRTTAALIGKNATGKSTFLEGISLFAEIKTDGFFTTLKQGLISYLDRKYCHNLESKNFLKFNGNFITVHQYENTYDGFRGDISLNTFQEITLNEIIDVINRAIDQVISPMKSIVFKFSTDKNEYKYLSINNDLVLFKNDIEISSFKNHIRVISVPKIITTKDETSFRFNANLIDQTVKDFFKPVKDNILSPDGIFSFMPELDRRRDLQYHMEPLIKEFGMDFINELVRILDPSIASIIRNSNNSKFFSVIPATGREAYGINSLSLGTKKIIKLFGDIAQSLKEGKLLFIDELDNGIQTRVVKLIVSLFNDERINKNGSQLIFTTHSIEFMRRRIIMPKNYFVSYREDTTIKFDNYWNLMKGIRVENRMNASKYYDEDIFEKNKYPFMITHDEKNTIIELLAEVLSGKD
ncbi:MAG: ATP-binding protein [Mycoplasmataceae bacterium]|nr:ATP-binding protein [Mycoplasmataceae bacterium]